MTIFHSLEVGKAELNIITVAITLLEDRNIKTQEGDDDLEKQILLNVCFYHRVPNTSITTDQEISKVVPADVEKYH